MVTIRMMWFLSVRVIKCSKQSDIFLSFQSTLPLLVTGLWRISKIIDTDILYYVQCNRLTEDIVRRLEKSLNLKTQSFCLKLSMIIFWVKYI